MSEHTLAQSQIVPDDSLGTEKSQIINNFNGVAQEGITGGSVRGMNLFHSFREFHVSEGKTVYFANPTGIENILARVTGSNRSEILGKLGVLGNANLFLLNPNGIIFGSGASLDIRGSFVATSANSIKFGEQGLFSASSPQPVPLLTIQPSALLFNQIGAGAIENSSIAAAGVNQTNNRVLGLRVADGNSLLLVGGKVLNAGRLNALGGRVELGSVASVGEVGLSIDGNKLSLTFPQGLVRGDISLRNGAIVNVASGGGGAIALTGNNIELKEDSLLNAGIGASLGTPATQAGDINLKATQAISLSQSSRIINQVGVNATGNGGNINIQAGSLNLIDGSLNGNRINTPNFGTGNSGNINIQVDSLNLSDNSRINSSNWAIGNSGNINIQADSLNLIDNSQISSFNLGTGNSGNIFVDVKGAITLKKSDNSTIDRVLASVITTQVAPGAEGNSGDIHLKAESLTLLQGSSIINSTFGRGNSGNIFVDIQGAAIFDGESLEFPSGIVSQVAPPAVGNSGDIHLKAESLTLTQGAGLSSSTFGRGNGGNIFVDVKDSVKISGEDSTGFSSGIRTQVIAPSAVGSGGEIHLKANSLNLAQGGSLSTSTFAQGNAGNIYVDVGGVINIDGETQSNSPSGITTKSEERAVGNSGNIDLKAESLNLTRRANLSASTAGQGKGGNIQIETSKFVNLSNDAEISVNSQSQGNAGDVGIKTNSLTLGGRSQLLADTFSSEGGNIQLQIRDLLLLRDNSSISTTAGLQEAGGNGGNIDINTKFLVTLPNENSDIIANAFAGKGGLIRINTQGIFGIERSETLTNLSDITAFSQQNPQLNGEIIINTPNADINNELVALPTNVVDASRLITQGCAVSTVANRQSQSQFTITGRGGIPPQPNHALRVPAIAISANPLTTIQLNQPLPFTPPLEANTLSLNDQGQIILSVSPTAYASTFGTNYGGCHGA
ncbi:two-partner secretion domain-containing protein [Nostoc sp. CMAA1605]|uniref:two-partner secretion domain-containing protein n=1 Tax=Nostoc sp. CMAA1605 TaxID=2055159 RepID=UPI001F3D1DA7|nr:filamentous hemagglutinin N-terminal domain-containing protein [Nostoc sp. CMAA1605]